jgi:hypothetical protein
MILTAAISLYHKINCSPSFIQSLKTMPIPETFDFLISNDLVGLQLSDDLNADP